MSGHGAGLVVLVGLTGVGKSSAVDAVLATAPDARLLLNRRELADRIVLPEAQRAEGTPVAAVHDRLERFRLTDRYRREHPGGLAHALERYLADHAELLRGAGPLLFDNLRGEEEVGYAVAAFPSARFVALEASAATRVLRLAGRGDDFDRVTADDPRAHASLLERLSAVPGLAQHADLAELARAAAGLDPDAVVTGARVVAEESRYYDPTAAWSRLEPLPTDRRLRLDTGRLERDEVAAAVLAWL